MKSGLEEESHDNRGNGRNKVGGLAVRSPCVHAPHSLLGGQRLRGIGRRASGLGKLKLDCSGGRRRESALSMLCAESPGLPLALGPDLGLAGCREGWRQGSVL